MCGCVKCVRQKHERISWEDTKSQNKIYLLVNSDGKASFHRTYLLTSRFMTILHPFVQRL